MEISTWKEAMQVTHKKMSWANISVKWDALKAALLSTAMH